MLFYLFSSLLQHKYVSIAEVQIKREEELQQCPMTLVGNMLHVPLKWPTWNRNPNETALLGTCFVNVVNTRAEHRFD